MDAIPKARTQLARAMEAFGLRPMDVVRTAERIAERLGRESLSRQWFSRLRTDPEVNATTDKIWILVAAFRELTGRLISASDLVEIEPPWPNEAWGTSDASNPSVPLSSGLPSNDRRRPLMDRTSTLPAEEAFETLYTQYGVILRGIAMRRYHVSPDEAEGLVHDVFLASLERNTSIRDMKGWLIGATHHKCVDYWRSRGRETALPAEYEETADPCAGIEAESLQRLTVATAISQLGARCREALRRFYWKGESTDDIAASYSTTPNNVKQILFTCRRHMRNLLTRQGRQP